ncbi:MAG TPA: HRDC domain-containing protein [Acidimicrobiales bacterium]|nr:HRDC domain-containing protein [Acidimicrobiales bacterium]
MTKARSRPGRSRSVLVTDQAELEALVGEAATVPVYALDTEFHRERTYYPRLALLQMAWKGQVALVDALAVDLTVLRALFEGPGQAVVHAAAQDLEVLEHACGTVPARLFDTQLAAGFLGFSSPSLVVLIQRVLGVRLPKGDRLTDWTRRPLTAEQLAYAAADVEHLVELRDELVDRLLDRGRLEWAEEECENLRARGRQRPEPEAAWWRLKESRQLRGRARGVAQEVAAWRERRAAALDVPPRYVLSELTLSSIAQRPPRTRAELSAVRGLDGRHLPDDTATELLAAVRRGQELPEEALVRPPTDDVDRSLRPAVALASALVSHLAALSEVDTALLATRADLQAFVRGDPEARLAHGWRHQLAGRAVRALVEGQAAVALDGTRLVLEARSYQAPASTTAAEGATRPG